MTATHPGHDSFRPDIEGLRAVAVLPILFVHAGVSGFAGGFIGVDIFFVISGFLITGILLRDLSGHGFSFAGFYRRRILRLLPALIATLLLSSIVAFIAMTPNELVGFAHSLIATLLFASNCYFYGHTGYFSQSAASIPLLHTWSLGVEEQFYIFWPILLAAVSRIAPRYHRTTIALITLFSFLLSIWMVERDMSGAFFLLPFRAWEFGLGALLANLSLERRCPRLLRECAGIVGLAVLLYCMHSYRQPIAFPGLTALPPCLATAALLICGRDSLAGRALSLAPIRFIGRISYSLYLWHWPIIVFSALWLFLPPSPLLTAGQIGLSIAVAVLSHHLIEQRGRRWIAPLAVRTLLIGATATLALAILCGAAVIAFRGFPGRYPAADLRLASVLDRDEQAAYRRGSCFVVDADDRYDARTCLRDDPLRRPSILLLGDSLAAHYWPGLDRYGRRYDIRQATMIGCPPAIYESGTGVPCQRFFRTMLTRWIPDHRPDAVMMSGSWQVHELPDVEATLAYLMRRRQRTIILGPLPRYELALPRLLFFGQGGDLAQRNLVPYIFEVDRRLRGIAARYGATYISLVDRVCTPARQCRLFATADVPLQFDTAHLTHEGSEEVMRLLMPSIDAAMRQSANISALPKQ